MSCMFKFCYNFNQILNWNTIRVVNMKSMFVGCDNFNQISKWNFENVTNVDYMFYYNTIRT